MVPEPVTAPLVKQIDVPWTQERAFRRFTAEIGTWWPTEKFSIGMESIDAIVFEERAGGRVYEQLKNGDTAQWGTVLHWEAPRRFVMTWHPGRDVEDAQEVEVVFDAVADGTRVTLTMTGWDILGPAAAEGRAAYDGGWAVVLASFAER